MNLPTEVLLMIYEYVPLYSLLKYRRINKNINDTIGLFFYYARIEPNINGVIQKYLDTNTNEHQITTLLGGRYEKEIVNILIQNYRQNDFGIDSDEYLGIHASFGHFEHIKFVLEKEHKLYMFKIWCFNICYAAACNNHFNIVIWIINKIYNQTRNKSGNKITCFGKYYYKQLFHFIVQHGNTEMIEWSLNNGYSWIDISHDIIKNGLVENHKILFEHLKQYNFDTGMNIIEIIIYLNNLEFLIWARDNHFSLCHAVNYAAKYNHFSILKWLIENGYEINDETCYRAIRYNNLKLLQWLIIHGCEYTANMCMEAAKNGHFEILKWLRSNGCPWDKSVCYFAIRNYNLKILNWAIDNGAELTVDDYFKAVALGYKTNSLCHCKYFFKYYFEKIQ